MAIPFATITFPEEFESTNEVFVSLKIKYRDNPGFVLSAWIHFYLKTLYALGKGLHADGLKLMLESWARHPFGQKYEIDSDLVLLENGDPYGEAYVLEVSGATFPATVITHLPKGGNKNRFAYAVVALAEAIFAGEDRKYLALSIDLIQFYHVSDKPYSKSSAIMGAYQYLLPKLVTWKFDVSAESVLSETGQTGERHEHEEKLRAEEEARKLREEEELRRQKEEEARKLREEE